MGLVSGVLVLGMLFFGVVPVWADTINVGPGETYTTIQAAINAANDGDTIQVAAGTYNENLVIADKSLILQGENKNTTIIDGSGTDYVVTITADTVGNITIRGFTIQNGTRGISAQLNQASAASLKISNNIIHNIIDDGGGRGIHINSDTPGDAVNAIMDSNEIYDVITAEESVFSISQLR